MIRSDHKVFIFVIWRSWRLWPQRAYWFACVVFAGTSVGLAGSRVLEGVRCGCCAPSDPAGSFIVEILHCGEGRNVEQVAQTLKQFSFVLRLLISLLTHLCIYRACLLSLCSSITCLILLVLNRYTCLSCLISYIVIIVYSLYA